MKRFRQWRSEGRKGQMPYDAEGEGHQKDASYECLKLVSPSL